MKIWIAGPRRLNSTSTYYWVKIVLLQRLNKRDTVRTGGARGIDRLAEQIIIKEKLCKLLPSIKPNWARYGKGAGKMRNTEGVEWCDKVIVFWDGKEEGGTWDVIEKAKKYGKELLTFKQKEDEK